MNKNVLMIGGGIVLVIVIAILLLAWPKHGTVVSDEVTSTADGKPVQAL